jgi:magnesium transporter
MSVYKLFEQIQDNIDSVVKEQPPLGATLWQELIRLHPADIAQLISYLDPEHAKQVFIKLQAHQKLEVFTHLNDSLKKFCLAWVHEADRSYLLSNLPLTDLTDFLDELSDQELHQYLKLLRKHERDTVLSLLQFKAQSAGSIMETNVLSLREDFTVEKSIHILQRVQPNKDLHQEIFVTDSHNRLVGSIRLEDLVLKHPKTRLKSILQPNPLVVQVDQDQEDIAQKMIHYALTIAPVVEEHGVFLGVISTKALVKIVEEEATEDIYLMSAIVPIRGTYFETPFFKLFYQRSSILIILLLFQVTSSIIAEHYEALLAGFLTYFIATLISTGGNASSQTSAFAIQGMATGEINESTRLRFILREFRMALLIGVLLGIFLFFRIYVTHGNFTGSIAVSLSLAAIIIVSMTLGSCMPLLLKRLNVDPAHSAGPLLTTFIDVIGLLMYCFISQLILK